MNDTPLKPQDDAIERVRAGYLMIKAESVVDPLLARSGDEEPIGEALRELAEHLRSSILATSTPFLLIRQAVAAKRFQAIHSSERIMAIDPHNLVTNGPDNCLSLEAAEKALKNARAKLADELSGGDGYKEICQQIRHELRWGLDDAEAGVAAQELLNQGVVSVWSAFEVFAKNVAKSIVNKQPSKGILLITSESTKLYFGGKGSISASTIADHGFDLKNSMGDVIFESNRMDSLTLIKSVFDVLFQKSPEVSNGLRGRNLRLLNQRRNLLVHKRGIVDRHYLMNAGDNIPLCERLSIKGDELGTYLNTVRDLALVIADSARESLTG